MMNNCEKKAGAELLYLPITYLKVRTQQSICSIETQILKTAQTNDEVLLPLMVNFYPPRFGIVVEGVDRLSVWKALGYISVPVIPVYCAEEQEGSIYYLLTQKIENNGTEV